MDYLITYAELRDDWVPVDANVLLETVEPHEAHVVYAHEGDLNILRFFPIGNKWNVSHDFSDSPEFIDGLGNE